MERNRRRDRTVTRILRKAGWRVVRIWEQDLRGKNAVRSVGRVLRALTERTL